MKNYIFEVFYFLLDILNINVTIILYICLQFRFIMFDIFLFS